MLTETNGNSKNVTKSIQFIKLRPGKNRLATNLLSTTGSIIIVKDLKYLILSFDSFKILTEIDFKNFIKSIRKERKPEARLKRIVVKRYICI